MGLGSIVKGAVSGFAGSGGNPLGAALGAAGGLIGAAKGGVKGGDPLKTWDTVPKPIQDAILNTYLPGILTQYNKERVPTPMMRASTETTGPLAMRGSANLQRYSDSVGGMFQPMFPQAKQQVPQQPQMNQAQMNGMAMMPMLAQGMGASPKAGWQWERFMNSASPDQLNQMAQTIGVGRMGSGMMGGGVVDPKTGQLLDYGALMAEVLRG